MIAHSAKGVLDAVERHHIYNAGAILREVTILDPEVMRMKAAYYRLSYPDSYYGTSSAYAQYDISGIDLDELPADLMSRKDFRRIDALMFGARDKFGVYQRTAVEVKISRADFRRDTDEKRQAWANATHRFIYAVPAGLVSADEVPRGCGLWEVDFTVQDDAAVYGNVRVAKRAVINREPVPLADEPFVAYMAGRASRAEWERRSDARLNTALAELDRAKGIAEWYRKQTEEQQQELRKLRRRLAVAS